MTKNPFQNEDLSRRVALDDTMLRLRSHPYLARYGRSLRPCLAPSIAPLRRSVIPK
jgi:hypothetical protein